jgi:nucleoside-diphosphate-sugar epimerase
VRILIIGGTRFIGPQVVRQLTNMHHHVTVFHRGQSPVQLPTGVEHIYGDRRSLPAFRREFNTRAPHLVLDMIPMNELDAQSVMETFMDISQRMRTTWVVPSS